MLLELDLSDAVLVGHSLGGVAVQAFVIAHPELARERVRGIVLLSTLAKSPFGSRPTQFKSVMERTFNHVPDAALLWDRRNLGFLAARLGFGKDPHPSHVELVRRMMQACAPETRRDAPRVLETADHVGVFDPHVLRWSLKALLCGRGVKHSTVAGPAPTIAAILGNP